MKRALGCLVLLLGLTAAAGAQEEEKGPNVGFMWANFAILAVGLGVLIRKHVPALLRARSEEIQKAIEEAAKLKAESEARLAEIERRLTGIGSEIDKLRIELISEMNAEGNRLRGETERLVTRVHSQAQQEIQFMAKASRLELKAYSAELAIDMASQRIKARMNHDTQHGIVEAFLNDLRKDGGRGMTPQ